MKRHAILVSAIWLMALPAFAAQRGEWTLNSSGVANKVTFSLQQSGSEGHHQSSSSSDWNRSDFKGMDWSGSGRHDVAFTIVRDAGTLVCEGFWKDGEGAGLFQFSPNANYVQQMSALGFKDWSEEKQFAAAVQDVSIAFAREMKESGLQGLTTDKLIAFRIFGVSTEYVRVLGRLGYGNPESDKLIALRIHGVTPEYIESLRSHGVRNLTLDQLIALRIQGIN